MELRTETIEIIIDNVNVKEFTLGNLPNLRNAKLIKTIEAYSVAQIPIAPSGKAVSAAAVFAKAFLRLVTPDNSLTRTIPLFSLNKTLNGSPVPDINATAIDPDKSSILVGSIGGLVANEVFLLAVTYEK